MTSDLPSKRQARLTTAQSNVLRSCITRVESGTSPPNSAHGVFQHAALSMRAWKMILIPWRACRGTTAKPIDLWRKQ